MSQRKKVALLFTGGSRLPHSDGDATIVRSQADIVEWMRIFPEINMLADIVPFFVAEQQSKPLQTVWGLIVESVHELHHAFDSFAVIHQDPDLTLTSSALTFGMPNIDDTIAIGALGVKPGMELPRPDERLLDPESYSSVQSSLVNLIRASLMPLNTIALVDGHRIFRANLITRDPETQRVVPVTNHAALGLIDFNINVHHGRRKPHVEPIFQNAFSPNVAVVPAGEMQSNKLPAGTEALVIDARTQIHSVRDLEKILRASPIEESIIVSPSSVHVRTGRKTLTRARLTFESSVAKTAWLIANGVRGVKFGKSLQKPLAGELLPT